MSCYIPSRYIANSYTALVTTANGSLDKRLQELVFHFFDFRLTGLKQ